MALASCTRADLDAVAAEISALGRRALPLATDATDSATLAVELAPKIRGSAIAPGLGATGNFDDCMGADTPEKRAQLLAMKGIPMARCGTHRSYRGSGGVHGLARGQLGHGAVPLADGRPEERARATGDLTCPITALVFRR